MPLRFETPTSDIIELKDFVDWMRAEKINTASEEDMARTAPFLKMLSNNRSFLTNSAIDELKAGYTDEGMRFVYSAQVMMLHRSQGEDDNFYIRANFWPAADDQITRAAGMGPFFYFHPHDHNFNFLTVGYHGPGYWSNYYEYKYGEVNGYPGEHVPSLKFIEKSQLKQGDVMLYRASVDVHEQLPPEEMSITLNVMEDTPRVRLRDQYSFDLENACIAQIININPSPCIFSIVAMLGGGNGEDVLNEIIDHSPDPFLRFSAHKSLAARTSDKTVYRNRMALALKDKSPMVTEWAQRHIEEICPEETV